MNRVFVPVFLLCPLLLGACAIVPEATTPSFADKGLSLAAASQAVSAGNSKAEVLARLGPAETIRFDSGYEVWVYRAKGSRQPGASAELVILFEPSGRVGKTRMRAAPS
jgi:hypothetical protein